MYNWRFLVLVCSLLVSGTANAQNNAPPKSMTDKEIRAVLIRQSIARYSGNCPCPYSTTSNGRRCGKRSAYSKPGGYSPLCYPADVSTKMVEKYRKDKNIPK